MLGFCLPLRNYRKDVQGNITVLTAVAAVGLMAASGAALDYFRALDGTTSVEAALDAAVLAVAASGETDQSVIQKSGLAVFQKNIGRDDLELAAPKFALLANGNIQGTITGEINTSLLRVAGISKFPIRATAEATRPHTSACIILKNPTAAQALLVNSGANVELNGCAIHGHSEGNPAAIFNSGASLTGGSVCLAGKDIIKNGGVIDNLSLGCAVADDPYAGKIAQPSSSICDFNGGTQSGSVTLSPGVYCGGTNFNASTNVTLKPGLYVIKGGDWNVDGGTWTGDGVTFYFADSSRIQFNSAVKSKMTAPSSGPYSGILFAEKEGLKQSPFIFDDNQGFEMTGVIYLPSRQVTFNSGGNFTQQSFTGVFDTMILNNVHWKMVPSSSSSNGQVALVK